jgi:hypothetical protein
MTQENALIYITTQKNGYMDDLQEKIGPKMVEGFKAMGFLRAGIDPESRPTWAKTSSADSFLKIYRSPNFLDRLDGFLGRVLRVV